MSRNPSVRCLPFLPLVQSSNRPLFFLNVSQVVSWISVLLVALCFVTYRCRHLRFSIFKKKWLGIYFPLLSLMNKNKSYTQLNHFSKAWLRFRYRTRSWIYTHGGSTFAIAKRVMEPLQEHFKTVYSISRSTEKPPPQWDEIYKKWVLTVNSMLRFGGFSENNNIHVYNVGLHYFKDLWNAIDQSKTRILMEMYNIEPDESGLTTIQKLEEAAARGVELKLIFDAFGSSNIDPVIHFAKLKEFSNVEVYMFNPPRLLGFFKSKSWVRTHRKLCVIDDKIAFCGGMNLSNKYRDQFRDSHCMLTGACVEDLMNMFYETYEEASRIQENNWKPKIFSFIPKGTKFWNYVMNQFKKHQQQNKLFLLSRQDLDVVDKQEKQEKEIDRQGIHLQILGSYPRRGRKYLHRAIQMAIAESHQHCYITTPYFLPPRSLVRAILQAKKQGSDVRILTAGLSDVPLFRLGSLPLYGMFLKEGIKIYEYHAKTLHAKTITSDGFFCSAGSYNLDRMSFYSNLELGWCTFDVDTAKVVEEHFEEDLKQSKEISFEDWKKIPWYKIWLGKFLFYLMLLIGP